MTEEELDNVIIFFKEKTVAPARLAGRVLLVHETLDQEKENRKAWVYNPGQRRVRRAPNVAFDNPRSGSDGLMTSDQYDMYNGSPQRYNWELVGKREMYVPYNAYKVHSDKLKYKDYIKPLHADPEYLRYELHRVWVVEATLKEGMRHQYKRRTFYIDEDSWQIVVGRYLRQPGRVVACIGRPWHQLLRCKEFLDYAGAQLRSPVGSLSRLWSGQ